MSINFYGLGFIREYSENLYTAKRSKYYGIWTSSRLKFKDKHTCSKPLQFWPPDKISADS